ncbi:MAG: OmpA family protein, partial [Saprospiraceae bacterium]|nr:OmpA family protein [Saprospiraceae bacterium]
ELMQMASMMQKNKVFNVKLLGYTDDSGTSAYNLDLSKRRAEAARTALVGLGVAPERISAEGLGEADPVAPNTTEANRARNRRVMMQLVKK